MPILQPSQMGLQQGNAAPQTMPQGNSGSLQPSQMTQQASTQTQQPQQQPQDGPQLHDTGSFLGNVGNSIGNFAGAIGNAVMHPIDTVTNIGKGIIGGGENLAAYATTGKSAAENNKGDQFTAVADNIGHYISQRYGSLDAAKQTAYQDPVGFLADASAVLGGAGAAVGKVGEFADASKLASLEASGDPFEAGALSQTGSALSKAGEIANPINMAGKVAGTVLSPITDFAGRQVANMVGAATGAGGSSIKEGLAAAKAGNSDFINAARGNISDTQIINTATDALDNLKQAKNVDYQAQLSKVKDVAGNLDYQPVVEEFRKQLSSNGITIKNGELNFENARGFQNPSEQAVLSNAYEKIQRWGDVPANNTLYGLDGLKQQLSDFYEQAGRTKSGAVIAQVKNTLSDILKTNPEYKQLVEPYETTSKLIDEMKSGLVSKNPETTLKKLTKAMSQDNAYRQSLISELNKYTPNGEDLKAQLAGLNMKSWTNNSKLFTYGEVGTALFNPHLLPTFIASSPRVIAEFLNGLGYSAGKIDQGLSLLKEYKAASNKAAIVNTAGRVQKATSNSSGNPQQSKGIMIKPIK